MTNQSTATDSMKMWTELLQKSMEPWTKAFSNPTPFGTAFPNPFAAAPNPFGAAPNPFQAVNPYELWQQYFGMWMDLWSKAPSASLGTDAFKQMEKQWGDQLEAMANYFSQSMSTEQFSQILGKTMEQSLFWQDKIAKNIHPQLDATYRYLNIPSRSQIDRLFDRVIDLSDRLGQLEDQSAELLKRLKDRESGQSVTAEVPSTGTPRPRRGTPEAGVQAN